MKLVTRRNFRAVALLALLALLTVLVIRRIRLTELDENGLTVYRDEVVAVVDKLEHLVVHYKHEVVAILALVALLTFVMWAALRANPGEDEATPPAGGSSASDRTAFR